MVKYKQNYCCDMGEHEYHTHSLHILQCSSYNNVFKFLILGPTYQ